MLREARTAAEWTQVVDDAGGMLALALAFRGHLFLGAPVAAASPAVSAQLAMLGVGPPGAARATMRSWMNRSKGMKERPWVALPWLADLHDTNAIRRIEDWARTGLRNPPVQPPVL